jgi:hypothetical protein
MIEPSELVRRLRQASYRSKTGILLLPVPALGQEANIAAQLDIQHVDFAASLLSRIPQGSNYVDVTLRTIIDDLDQIANAASGMDCVLVSQIDVAVTKLTFPDRARFWPRLLGDFPNRRKGLLLSVPDVPDGLEVLHDESIRRAWINADRVAKWRL